jgi:hypothetical protein
MPGDDGVFVQVDAADESGLAGVAGVDYPLFWWWQ